VDPVNFNRARPIGVRMAWASINGAERSSLARGLAGLYFHYQGSAEFKLESNPSLRGWPLFWAAVKGKAPPLLAPGAMMQLGLVGWVYTFKHPALDRAKKEGE